LEKWKYICTVHVKLRLIQDTWQFSVHCGIQKKDELKAQIEQILAVEEPSACATGASTEDSSHTVQEDTAVTDSTVQAL